MKTKYREFGMMFTTSDPTPSLPSDISDILTKCIYWNKEVEALWMQNTEAQGLSEKVATAFYVTVKANTEGLFINGNLAVDWNNKHIVKDNMVLYSSHSAVLTLMEKGLNCKFRDDEIVSYIICEEQFVTDSFKEFVTQCKSAFLIQNFCNYPYWKNETIYVARNVKNNAPKYKGKIMANEEGLYLDGDLLYCWNDYIQFVRNRGVTKLLEFFKKTELVHWGDSQYGFYPQDNMFTISDKCIIRNDEAIIIGDICKVGCDYESLRTRNDISVVNENFSQEEHIDNTIPKAERNNKNYTLVYIMVAFIILFFAVIGYRMIVDHSVSGVSQEYIYEEPYNEGQEKNQIESRDASSIVIQEKLNEDTQESMVQRHNNEVNYSAEEKAIRTRLTEICKALTSYESTKEFLTNNFLSILNRADSIDPFFMDWDMFLDAQDNDYITYDLLSFDIIDTNRVKVKLNFIDSTFGTRPTKIIYFVIEDNVWKIDDLTMSDGKSTKEYAKDFINQSK